MTPKHIFLSILLFLLLMPSAFAIPVRFTDINLNSRQISVYQVNETGSQLIYHGNSDNSTCELDPAYGYQVVSEPSRLTWLDDPRNAFSYLVNSAAGQSITFLLFAFTFIGLIKIAIR